MKSLIIRNSTKELFGFAKGKKKLFLDVVILLWFRYLRTFMMKQFNWMVMLLPLIDIWAVFSLYLSKDIVCNSQLRQVHSPFDLVVYSSCFIQLSVDSIYIYIIYKERKGKNKKNIATYLCVMSNFSLVTPYIIATMELWKEFRQDNIIIPSS